jgi:hypothetical protein
MIDILYQLIINIDDTPLFIDNNETFPLKSLVLSSNIDHINKTHDFSFSDNQFLNGKDKFNVLYLFKSLSIT